MNKFLNSEIRISIANCAVEMIKQGQPSFFLYNPAWIEPFEEATWFLHQLFVSRGRSSSFHTWQAAAWDLKIWLDYCQSLQIDWRDASEATRERFRDDQTGAISSRGVEYGEATINRRLSVVRHFYQFAESEGWYFGDIGNSVRLAKAQHRPIDGDALAHTRSTVLHTYEQDTMLLKVGRKDVIRPIQIKQLRELLNHLGQEPVADAEDIQRMRNRLIVDCGWVCGMRLNDVVTMTTFKVLSVIVGADEEMKDFPIVVERGKGNVSRQVAMPGWLVLRLQDYIVGERAESEKAASKRCSALFLGHPDSKSAGKPLTGSAIQKMFAQSCLNCGIVEIKHVEEPESGRSFQKTVPAHSYHDLRHCCAVLTYHTEKAVGNAEPWKIVQRKLGHKSLKVTMDTYLAHVEIFGEKQGLVDVRRLVGLR
jgi:site-specific recombinase XerD